MSDEKKIRQIDTREVNRRITELDAREFSANDGSPPLNDQQDTQQEPSRRPLAVGLVVLTIVLLLAASIGVNTDSQPEKVTVTAVTTVPVALEEPVIENVPPTIEPQVITRTAEVPIYISGVDVTEVESELSTVESLPGTVEVSVATPEMVNQTKVEMRTIETPEGVTENQFEGMEQTSPQPQAVQTVPQPQIEQSTVVAAPVPSVSTYPSAAMWAPVLSFSAEVVSYLPVESFVPKPLVWWKRVIEGTSYMVRDLTTAQAEARYFVEVGKSSTHQETINLALIVPRVDGVRDVRTDDKTEFSEDEVRDKLITDACLDVDNLRAVMDQAKTDLAAEAGGYELVLSWYTHRGERVAQSIGDAELISYCQLG